MTEYEIGIKIKGRQSNDQMATNGRGNMIVAGGWRNKMAEEEELQDGAGWVTGELM